MALFVGLHQFDVPGGMALLIITQYVFAFAFVLKGSIDLLNRNKNNVIGMGSIITSVIALGIALKLSYVAYANYVIEFSVVGLIVLLLVLRVEADDKAILKVQSRNLLYGVIPMMLVGCFVLIFEYNEIFTYHHKSKLAWNIEERVNWDSFQGSADYRSEYDATIFSNINFRYRIEFNELHYIAVAYFDKNRSWHKDGTEPLLEHEKMHFDITEVYAAKIREYFEGLKELDELPSRGEIDLRLQAFLDEWDDTQNKYDHETEHGLNYTQQLAWQNRVDDLLAEYDNITESPTRFIAYHDYFYEYDEVVVETAEPVYMETRAGEEIYTEVHEMPQFPGGKAAMYEFLASHVRYPTWAKENGVSGIVYVSFVVDKDGTIRREKIEQGIGGGCDEEALRVVRRMPRWTPGVAFGNNVKVRFKLPIHFSLE